MEPAPQAIARVEALAAELRRDHPQLALERRYEPCRAGSITPGGTLHLDDLSEIAIVGQRPDGRFLQERARLRAGDNDFVAASFVSEPAFARYCRDRLGLGDPTWLAPAAATDDPRLANACWWDRVVRKTLLSALRGGALRWIHPHLGGRAVWDLAMLLQRRSGIAPSVMAPPPGLTAWVNDKISFAETVTRLLGQGAPRVEETTSLAWLSRRIRDLAEQTPWIVIKTPDSAGSYGTVVLDTTRYRGRGLGAIRAEVLPIVTDVLGGVDHPRLLVRGWETAVIASPSSQLWIPPEADGPPIVEGVFLQALEGHSATFVGSHPGRLPETLERRFAENSWLLGRLFQRLGYVGRCSFDAIITDRSGQTPDLGFVECNGRWGGTSGPMSLMNRLFGDWARRPFAVRTCWASGLDRCRFADVLDFLGDDLFDARTGAGSLIVLGPGRMRLTGKLNVIALDQSAEAADTRLRLDVTTRLRNFAAHAVAGG